jgi:hypothetical protein
MGERGRGDSSSLASGLKVLQAAGGGEGFDERVDLRGEQVAQLFEVRTPSQRRERHAHIATSIEVNSVPAKAANEARADFVLIWQLCIGRRSPGS